MSEKYTFNGEEIDPSSLYYQYKDELAVHEIKPNHTVTFNNHEGKQVGSFDFNGPSLVFKGDVEESAKVFIEWIAQAFESRLKEEYQRGYEDCLTDEGMR